MLYRLQVLGQAWPRRCLTGPTQNPENHCADCLALTKSMERAGPARQPGFEETRAMKGASTRPLNAQQGRAGLAQGRQPHQLPCCRTLICPTQHCSRRHKRGCAAGQTASRRTKGRSDSAGQPQLAGHRMGGLKSQVLVGNRNGCSGTKGVGMKARGASSRSKRVGVQGWQAWVARRHDGNRRCGADLVQKRCYSAGWRARGWETCCPWLLGCQQTWAVQVSWGTASTRHALSCIHLLNACPQGAQITKGNLMEGEESWNECSGIELARIKLCC